MTEIAKPQESSPAAVSFAQHYIDAGGRRVRYLEAGQGEALIYLHGAGGLRLSRAHEMLARRCRVIAFEIPGFGESAGTRLAETNSELAAALWHAIDGLQIATVSLMGRGMGARLALEMALLRPDATKAIVLIAPMAMRGEEPLAWDVPAAERMALLYAHPERHQEARAIEARDRALAQRLIGPPRDPEFEARLAGLKIPVLALFGTRDKLASPEAAHLYREKLPDCNLMFIYDAAHAIDADRPEAVCSVAGDFLARQDQFLVSTESALLNP